MPFIWLKVGQSGEKVVRREKKKKKKPEKSRQKRNWKINKAHKKKNVMKRSGMKEWKKQCLKSRVNAGAGPVTSGFSPHHPHPGDHHHHPPGGDSVKPVASSVLVPPRRPFYSYLVSPFYLSIYLSIYFSFFISFSFTFFFSI